MSDGDNSDRELAAVIAQIPSEALHSLAKLVQTKVVAASTTKTPGRQEINTILAQLLDDNESIDDDNDGAVDDGHRVDEYEDDIGDPGATVSQWLDKVAIVGDKFLRSSSNQRIVESGTASDTSLADTAVVQPIASALEEELLSVKVDEDRDGQRNDSDESRSTGDQENEYDYDGDGNGNFGSDTVIFTFDGDDGDSVSRPIICEARYSKLHIRHLTLTHSFEYRTSFMYLDIARLLTFLGVSP